MDHLERGVGGRGVPGGSRRTAIILGQGWQGTWEIGYTQWEESKDKLLRIMGAEVFTVREGSCQD